MLPGAVIVARPHLVFFGIEIFLAPRQRRGFAKLEAGIHAPQAGQRRRQRRADQKARPARGLQEKGLISGVLTKKCGRRNRVAGDVVNSVR